MVVPPLVPEFVPSLVEPVDPVLAPSVVTPSPVDAPVDDPVDDPVDAPVDAPVVGSPPPVDAPVVGLVSPIPPVVSALEELEALPVDAPVVTPVVIPAEAPSPVPVPVPSGSSAQALATMATASDIRRRPRQTLISPARDGPADLGALENLENLDESARRAGRAPGNTTVSRLFGPLVDIAPILALTRPWVQRRWMTIDDDG